LNKFWLPGFFWQGFLSGHQHRSRPPGLCFHPGSLFRCGGGLQGLGIVLVGVVFLGGCLRVSKARGKGRDYSLRWESLRWGSLRWALWVSADGGF